MIESVGGFDIEKPRYDILFNLKDLEDFKQQIMYYLRYSDEHPKFGRYTWKQKFEYFGTGFGAVIMGFTGLLMWQPFEAMKYFPIGLVQIASLFHTWEAVLASIAIFIGHFYDEQFEKFPNLAWLTGNVPEEEMRHEHPLEYEEAMKSQQIANPENMEHKEHKNILIVGFAKLVFTIIFLTICIWMVWISYSVLMEAVKTYVLHVV